MSQVGLDRIKSIGSLLKESGVPGAKGPEAASKGLDFKNTLKGLETERFGVDQLQPKALGSLEGTTSLKFSNHAIERMQRRGISITPEELGRIDQAVRKAEGKGAKETLILTDESALIVSIKNKTVVTVMDKSNLKENVFTNIDSTVMI